MSIASGVAARYSGTYENASWNASGRRVQSAEQSIGVKSHLCGLTTTESAWSTPSRHQRSSGQTAAEPAYAASTWSHTPASAHRLASSGTGSTDVVAVVPTVATTAVTPSSSRSGSILNWSSTGALRYGRPTSRAAFSTLKFACSEATTTPPGRSVRAAASAAMVAVE